MSDILIQQLIEEVKASRGDMKEVRDRVMALELKPAADPIQCALHNRSLDEFDRRIVSLEVVAKRDNFLKVALGAVGVGLAFAVKYLVGFFVTAGKP